MSGSQYLTETDPDDGLSDDLPPLPSGRPSLPEGIAASRDNPQPLRDVRGAPPEEPFNIIETDDQFVPVDGSRQPSEPRLDEIDAGPRSLVDRRAAEDADRDQRGGRRLRTPAERRAAAREGRDRTLQELQALRRQNEELVAWKEQIEPQLAGIAPRLNEIDQQRATDQLAGLDRGIQEAQGRAALARRQISEAMIAQDGDALNSAMELRDNAVMETQRLTVQRNMLATGDPLGRTDQGQGQGRFQQQPRQAEQQVQQPARPPLTARAQAMVDDFAARHSWIRGARGPDGLTRGLDIDSDIALRLDAQVSAERYDPSSLEYWDRLDELMAQYLPHRVGEPQEPAPRQRQNANGDGQRRQAPPPERRGPMVGGGGGGSARSGNDVYLSPARKEAMMQAGILGRDGRTVENAEKFRRTLKQFQEYDRANGTARQ